MSRKEDVLAMVREGPVTVAQVSEKLKITSTNAAVLLGRLFREGVLARTGEEKKYQYWLPKGPSAQEQVAENG